MQAIRQEKDVCAFERQRERFCSNSGKGYTHSPEKWKENNKKQTAVMQGAREGGRSKSSGHGTGAERRCDSVQPEAA